MATMRSLPGWMQVFMRGYPYHVSSWSRARLERPLRDARVALVTTAGLHVPEDPPFHEASGGDTSMRIIPGGVDVQTLRIAHKSSAFDQSGAWQDRNLVFPLDRFRELEREGMIGSLNERHWSFMGSITRPQALMGESAPAVAAVAAADGVEVAFLTPA